MTVQEPPAPARLSADEWQGVRERAARRDRGRAVARRALGLFAAAFRRMPPSLALVAGEALGLAAWVVAGAARRRAAGHLELALGGRLAASARAGVVRRLFVNTGRSAGEILSGRRGGAAGLARRLVAVDGEEHLAAARAAGRGVVAITAHFGNWEMLAACLRLRCDLRVVGRAARGEDVTTLVDSLRAEYGVETIPQTNTRAILRALRAGATIGILPDQDIDRQAGIFVPFFGMPAYTPTGPATLALATGAPILPVFLRREGRSRHRMVFHAPLRADPEAPDRDAEVRRLTEAWSAVVEAEIAARPDHWVWFHRRWKTTPEGLARARAQRARRDAWQGGRRERRPADDAASVPAE